MAGHHVFGNSVIRRGKAWCGVANGREGKVSAPEAMGGESCTASRDGRRSRRGEALDATHNKNTRLGVLHRHDTAPPPSLSSRLSLLAPSLHHFPF